MANLSFLSELTGLDLSSLNSSRSGSRINVPTGVVIGAELCGTSMLKSYLVKHPQVGSMVNDVCT